MSLKLNIIFAIMLISELSFARAPGAEKVNNFISMALQVEESKLTNADGKFVCENQGNYTYGNSVEMAHTKAFLLCVKKQCDGVQDFVNNEIDRMRNLSNDDLRDLLNAVGALSMSDQIAEILKNGGYGGTTSCQSSQNARFKSYDFCVMNLYNCGELVDN